MATKKPKTAEADPPEDYYDTFHGRGQDEQDLHDAAVAKKPDRPADATGGWPFPGHDSNPVEKPPR